uniref:SUZ domain-containing protein n=1 Tax=Timema monikensis TaxID=170555 RepID=A0A7R9DXI7_9NEOP|nr:unnamed protein product [Timema monikensis]
MAAREEVNVIESWEDIEESGILDKKLLQSESLSQEEPEIMSQGMVSGPIILRDDSFGPQEPTVKILKRPQRTINGHSDSPILNGDLKPRQPVKTLQQREQEYAEARLRILGEARSPEEQLQAVTNDRDRHSSYVRLHLTQRRLDMYVGVCECVVHCNRDWYRIVPSGVQ